MGRDQLGEPSLGSPFLYADLPPPHGRTKVHRIPLTVVAQRAAMVMVAMTVAVLLWPSVRLMVMVAMAVAVTIVVAVVDKHTANGSSCEQCSHRAAAPGPRQPVTAPVYETGAGEQKP